MDGNPAAAEKAGLTIAEWCAVANLSRATFYATPDAQKPATVRIGRRVLILEPAADWLARMREAGGLVLPKREGATPRPATDPNGPKRKRGRPRKHPAPPSPALAPAA